MHITSYLICLRQIACFLEGLANNYTIILDLWVNQLILQTVCIYLLGGNNIVVDDQDLLSPELTFMIHHSCTCNI